MFVAEAIYPFSQLVINPKQKQQQNLNNDNKSEKKYKQNLKDKQQEQSQQQQSQKQKQIGKNKRLRSKSQNRQLQQQQRIKKKVQKQEREGEEKQKQQQNNEIKYLTFEKNDKILVRQTFQNGWWFGNTLKNPQIKGYFPSTYVKVGIKPSPPPLPPTSKPPQQKDDIKVFDPNFHNSGQDWVQKQIQKAQSGPIKSQYYHGITGHKMVKIDQKNQNILKGNHVKFDVNTGMAMVPIKDQAPTAKAVRQMGYYFDYHQWNQQRNRNPQKKARPDAKKKKQKKLNLKYMDR